MRRAFLILFVVFFSAQLYAQKDSVLVIVEMTSKTAKETIHNVSATIEIGKVNYYRTSNMKGQFSFKALPGDAITLKLSHTHFNPTKELKRISSKFRGDTIEFNYQMEMVRVQDQDALVVSAPGVPVTVFKSPRLHVSDFEIQNDGDLLLLTYPKRLKKGSELLLFDGKNVKSNFQVPGLAEELIRDYRGNPHVVCKDAIYGIYASDGQVGIGAIDKNYFYTYLAPIVDTNKTKLYFTTFNPDYPAFDYFSYDQLDSTYKKILSIKDDLMMELYRSEYKWVDVRTKLWARNKELATGVDAEIWVGANYFTQSLYYKELYAPLFHRNDSLFVFDYYKDKLYTFDEEGNSLDSTGIYHHYNPKSTGFKKELIQDRVTGQVYAIFELELVILI